jgi:hypothetical protein
VSGLLCFFFFVENKRLPIRVALIALAAPVQGRVRGADPADPK